MSRTSSVIAEKFQRLAYKRLKQVEVDPARSNQHEINAGVLRSLLRDPRDQHVRFPARLVYLSDETRIEESSELTWYDSRRNNPDRSPEYRLYFQTNPVMSNAEVGDLLVFGHTLEGQSTLIIAKAETDVEAQLVWLLGLAQPQDRFDFGDDPPEIPEYMYELLAPLLEAIGVERPTPQGADAFLGVMLERFGDQFPTVADFVDLAIETSPETDPTGAPDAAFEIWYTHNSNLFFTLESHLEMPRITDGYNTVDEMMQHAHQVRNRRNTRVGRTLELIVKRLLEENRIRYAYQVITENRRKPDFLFPGIEEYRDPGFPSENLAMLGCKTTLKERWQQITGEAVRIESKHLLTLGIPGSRTLETIRNHQIQLVVPAAFQEGRNPDEHVLDVAGLLEFVAERQEIDP